MATPGKTLTSSSLAVQILYKSKNNDDYINIPAIVEYKDKSSKSFKGAVKPQFYEIEIILCKDDVPDISTYDVLQCQNKEGIQSTFKVKEILQNVFDLWRIGV